MDYSSFCEERHVVTRLRKFVQLKRKSFLSFKGVGYQRKISRTIRPFPLTLIQNDAFIVIVQDL